jgi:short-subunit dehydrogenase
VCTYNNNNNNNTNNFHNNTYIYTRYGTTKAGLSQFAASLACEVMAKGIDVTVVHPSPVASNFYNNLAKIDALEMAKKMAVRLYHHHHHHIKR